MKKTIFIIALILVVLMTVFINLNKSVTFFVTFSSLKNDSLNLKIIFGKKIIFNEPTKNRQYPFYQINHETNFGKHNLKIYSNDLLSCDTTVFIYFNDNIMIEGFNVNNKIKFFYFNNYFNEVYYE